MGHGVVNKRLTKWHDDDDNYNRREISSFIDKGGHKEKYGNACNFTDFSFCLVVFRKQKDQKYLFARKRKKHLLYGLVVARVLDSDDSERWPSQGSWYTSTTHSTSNIHLTWRKRLDLTQAFESQESSTWRKVVFSCVWYESDIINFVSTQNGYLTSIFIMMCVN